MNNLGVPAFDFLRVGAVHGFRAHARGGEEAATPVPRVERNAPAPIFVLARLLALLKRSYSFT